MKAKKAKKLKAIYKKLSYEGFTNPQIKLALSALKESDVISVTKAGKLRLSKPNKYGVESSQKRNFIVDIKGPALAFLPVLAFEGGTRRNVPKFEVNAASPSTVIIVANAIMRLESPSVVQQKIMVKKLRQNLNIST